MAWMLSMGKRNLLDAAPSLECMWIAFGDRLNVASDGFAVMWRAACQLGPKTLTPDSPVEGDRSPLPLRNNVAD